jgi:hypothetical protein
MKIKIPTIAAVTVLASAQCVLAQVIFSDNFDSYADQAAMNAVWNVGLAPAGVGLTLSTEQAFSPSQSAKAPGTTTAYTMAHDFTPTSGSDALPLLWSFRFYDSTQANNLRQFASIRDNAPALAQLVAMGAYNDTTLTKDRHTGLSVTAADLNTYYAVRVAFAPGPNWFILNGPGAPTRSTGWHELSAVFKDTTVEFYVDGVNGLSDLSTSYAASAGALTFDRVTVGSGLSSANGEAYYDNVMVQVIPEPSSIVLSLLGGFGLAAGVISRRRKV